MSLPGAGFQYPPVKVAWLKRDVLLFAHSIGCTANELQFLYEKHPDFQTFPTYPIVLSFKDSSQEVIDFYAAEKSIKIPDVPEFDPSRVVDGQRTLKILKQLPTTSEGRSFEMRKKVIGVYDKGKSGSVLETLHQLVEVDSDEVYAEIGVWSFYVAQGNWGGPRGPSMEELAMPERQPDFVVERQTTPETPLLYRLNGDYNPLHATPEFGAAMGFGGVILHGLIAWNSACHAVLHEVGGSDARNLREFQARFAAPVLPGDKLTTKIWRTGDVQDGWEEIRFVTYANENKVCLKSGRALVKPTSDGDSKVEAVLQSRL